MDHHCPWVNNCIGFFNRKYFLQLVFYVVITTWYVNVTMSYEIFKVMQKLYHTTLPRSELMLESYIMGIYALNFTLSILITIFFKFHFGLLTIKSTTIEQLDKNHDEINKKVYLLVL